MPEVESAAFDLVLMECVFGFIADKAAAIGEIDRILKPGGKVAVTDFHYFTPPGELLRNALRREVGIEEFLDREAWRRHFGRFELKSWSAATMGAGGWMPLR